MSTLSSRARSPNASRDDVEVPLSFNQQMHLYLERLLRNRRRHLHPAHAVSCLRLPGALDTPALDAALNALVARHGVLRTALTFTPPNPTAQSVAPLEMTLATATRRATTPLSLDTVPLDHVSPEQQPQAIEQIAAEDFVRPFDYATPPHLRATLMRLSPLEHALLLTLPHMVCDRWSMQLLRRELARLYEAIHTTGDCRQVPAPAVDYSDFARWQREQAADGQFDASLAFWNQRWAEYQDAIIDVRRLSLAGGETRETISSWRMTTLDLDAGFRNRVLGFARDHRFTPYMLGLAALLVTLRAKGAGTRLAVWATFANRQRQEFEDVIGWFATGHLLGFDLTSDREFGESLRDVRHELFDVYTHQAVPTPLLLQQFLAEMRSTGRPHPAFDATHVHFDVKFEAHPRTDAALGMTPMAVSAFPASTGLHVLLTDTGDRLFLSVRYQTAHVGDIEADRLLTDLRRVMEAALAAPRTRLSQLIAMITRSD